MLGPVGSGVGRGSRSDWALNKVAGLSRSHHRVRRAVPAAGPDGPAGAMTSTRSGAETCGGLLVEGDPSTAGGGTSVVPGDVAATWTGSVGDGGLVDGPAGGRDGTWAGGAAVADGVAGGGVGRFGPGSAFTTAGVAGRVAWGWAGVGRGAGAGSVAT